MAASEGALGALHSAVAIYMKNQLEKKDEDGNPLSISAADVANILRFLKDNHISCQADDDNEVGGLADALNKRAEGRAKLTVHNGGKFAGEDDLRTALDDLGHSNLRTG